MRNLDGKKAFISGAASGIGRAIALRLAREGTDLYLVDVNEAGLNQVAREAGGQVEVVVRVCDLACPNEISAAVDHVLQHWGYLDILVNNAGVCFYGPTTRMSTEQWERLLAINLHAPIQLTQQFLPTLLSRPEAHILNVASILGLVAMGRVAAYSTSKFGLVGFSEALRFEYGYRGLGVTALCPGFAKTPLYATSECGHKDRPFPRPPSWLCTTPEKVADKAIQGIRRDKRLVLVTRHARLIYFLKRYAPGLFDMLARLGRRNIKRKAQRPAVKRPSVAASSGPPPPPVERKAG